MSNARYNMRMYSSLNEIEMNIYQNFIILFVGSCVRRVRERIRIRFTCIYKICVFHNYSCEFDSGGFLRILRFRLPIKMTAMV
jgi:hypothetical protein